LLLSSEMPNRSPRIVCTSKIGNLSVQVGLPPGVGSGYAHFEVLGVGLEKHLTRGVTIQTVQQHRGHKFADKPITRLSGHPKAKLVR